MPYKMSKRRKSCQTDPDSGWLQSRPSDGQGLRDPHVGRSLVEVVHVHVALEHLGRQPEEGGEPVACDVLAQEEADEEEKEQGPEHDPRSQQGIAQLPRGWDPAKEPWGTP